MTNKEVYGVAWIRWNDGWRKRSDAWFYSKKHLTYDHKITLCGTKIPPMDHRAASGVVTDIINEDFEWHESCDRCHYSHYGTVLTEDSQDTIDNSENSEYISDVTDD